jgi:hypothetical protein
MTQKKIDSILDTKYYHIFYKGKELKQLAQKTLNDIKKSIKKNVNPPKTEKKVYIVNLKYNPDSEKRKIIVVCGQYTITPKLALAKGKDDDCFSIAYSSDELKKFDFELSHIKKIINKIKKDELDVELQFINISDILK